MKLRVTYTREGCFCETLEKDLDVSNLKSKKATRH